MSSIPIKQKPLGFTIVELMIVMVVIAILAAITIVAYTGVQNRAHDAAVQNDLRQFGTQITMFHAQHGMYPTVDNEGLETLNVSVSAGSYSTTSFGDNQHNFIYCHNAGTIDRVAVLAMSLSGRSFAYVNGGVREFVPDDPTTSNSRLLCAMVGSDITASNDTYRELVRSGRTTWRSYVRT